MTTLKGISAKVRQIAIRGIGRDEPTLLITNDVATPSKALFARYAERMTINNELDAYISGFHLDALSSGVPLNVDLDTTLTVVAGNLYRMLARKLPRYETATPDKIWRHFLDATGTLHVGEHTDLRSQPAQPPPRADRRRLPRPGDPRPLVERPNPALPLPPTLNRAEQTSIKFPHRESRLTRSRAWRPEHATWRFAVQPV
jgi:hypothetical protein